MQELFDPSRREFTLASALALLGGVTITVSGCGGGSSSPTRPVGGPIPDVTGAISDNHGHLAVVTGAQMTAGNAIALDIQAEATHPHMVELSAADLGDLRNGRMVSKISSNGDVDAHRHQVTFQGPTPAPGGGYY